MTNLILIIYQVTAIIAVIHVVMDNRQPAKTMAWALFIYFIPIVGLLAYLFFGVNTRRKRVVSRHSLDQAVRNSLAEAVKQSNLNLPETHKPIIELFASQNFPLSYGRNKVDIMTDGYQFFPALLHDIASARHHIHINIYIFEDDPLGRLVADALIDKARQGVEVRLIYDDVGCWSVSNRFFARMQQAGIEVVPFLPVRFPRLTSKANYRNHRKLIIIDGCIGYVGGMNIALRYVKGGKQRMPKVNSMIHPRRLAWRDTMARIEGQGAHSLQQAFLVDWYFVDRTLLNDRKYYMSPALLEGAATSSGADGDSAPHASEPSANILLQTITSGPTSPMPEIMQGLVNIIMNAKHYVYMETPYFLPTTMFIFALKTAVSTGVDVRLLVPLHGDTWLTSWASRSFLREIAEAGVRVSLYEPGFLHSKLLVCDDSIATCGSTNIDFRSLENNFEVSTFFYSEEVACRMRDIYLADEQQSSLLTTHRKRMHPSFFTRLWESLTRLFSPLL